MAVVHYQVQAEVVDLRSDAPRSEDAFFVDTNVWYWLTYPRCRIAYKKPKNYQIKDYPEYIKRARKAGAKMLTCGLCFSELADLIERNELDIFRQAKGRVELKEFRHREPDQRSNVVLQIQDSWAMVKSFAEFLNILLDEDLVDKTCQNLSSLSVGPHDLFMMEGSVKAGIFQIITDDGDFAAIPGIRIFTANRNVIQAAQAQDKLIVR